LAIRLDPKHSTNYSNRGAAYNNKSDWDRAIADCTESIRLDPNYANAYRHRAFAYMQKGSYAQARAGLLYHESSQSSIESIKVCRTSGSFGKKDNSSSRIFS
jgi:tetratricopeptide (TPR) repeat protein